MVNIAAGIILLAIGWGLFMVFIAPILLAAKVIQVSREDKNGKDT